MYSKDVKNLSPISYSYGTMLMIPLVIIGSLLLNSFTLMKLWEWFLVPVAPVNELGFLGAMGLFVLVAVIWGSSLEVLDIGGGNEEPFADFVKKAAIADAKNLGCLVLGWLIHSMM